MGRDSLTSRILGGLVLPQTVNNVSGNYDQAMEDEGAILVEYEWMMGASRLLPDREPS